MLLQRYEFCGVRGTRPASECDEARPGHGDRPAARLGEAACAKRQPNWRGWVVGGTGARTESRLYRSCN